MNTGKNHKLEIGFGEADITPTPPVDNPNAFKVFDSIAFRAVVFRQGGVNAVLLSGDFFSFEQSLLDGVKERLRSHSWIDGAHIVASVSHCGGAPILFQSYINQPCEALRVFGQEEFFIRKAAQAVEIAIKDLKPAKVGFRQIEASGLSYNRRSYDAKSGKLVMSNFRLPYPQEDLLYGPLDSNIYVLRIDAVGEENASIPRGALVVYGCHALCNTDKLGNVSGDYPFYIRDTIRHAWNVPVHFMPGALGNVVPFDRAGRTYQIIGRAVGGMALYALEKTVTEEVELRVRQSTIKIPMYAANTHEEAKKELATAVGGGDGNMRFNAYTSKRFEMDDSHQASYTETCISLGNVHLLHLPGEIFVETAREIRQSAPDDKVIILSGPTADVGYLCPATAMEEGGMEPKYTSVDAQAEEKVRTAAIELLFKVKATQYLSV